MSDPTPVPPVTAVPTPEPVVVTPTKASRVLPFVKKTLTRAAVPALIGAAATYIVVRRNDSENEIEDDSDFPE